MQRDMDLIREILFEIEANDSIPSFDDKDDQYLQHVLLLNEAGLIDGITVSVCDRGELYPQVLNRPRLTWKGHEFLDSARNDTVWNSTKAKIKAALGSAGFQVVT